MRLPFLVSGVNMFFEATLSFFRGYPFWFLGWIYFLRLPFLVSGVDILFEATLSGFWGEQKQVVCFRVSVEGTFFGVVYKSNQMRFPILTSRGAPLELLHSPRRCIEGVPELFQKGTAK